MPDNVELPLNLQNYGESCNLTWCTCKFSACELSKEKPSFVFSFKEEDEDEDYLIHTLFLKNVSSVSQ